MVTNDKPRSRLARNVPSEAVESSFVKPPVKPKLTFYNFDKIYSYNGMYNFILGARGVGKTYGAVKKVVQKAITTGEEFILLRRWKTELTTKDSFFDAIIANNEFPEWDFRVSGMHAEMSLKIYADMKKRPWTRIGYFIALSQAQHYKGTPFPLVKTIIFDEFIIETGSMQYIKNEAVVMDNFYSTVDRHGDRTRVLFLANSVSIINPYFLEYKIEPQDSDEWIITARDEMNLPFIVCHFPRSENFQQQVLKTRFGKFKAGTDYSEYALANKFSDNHKAMIGEKPTNMRYAFTLESKYGVVSIWSYGGKYFTQAKRPKTEKIFTLVPQLQDEGKTLLATNDKLVQILRTAYRNNRMTFDKQVTRNIFIQVFTR